jgi:hypothetical protein
LVVDPGAYLVMMWAPITVLATDSRAVDKTVMHKLAAIIIFATAFCAAAKLTKLGRVIVVLAVIFVAEHHSVSAGGCQT